MQNNVGALRSEASIIAALDGIRRLTDQLGDTPPGDGNRFDMRRIDWFDLRNMLLVARVVAGLRLHAPKLAGRSSARTTAIVAGLGVPSDCEG